MTLVDFFYGERTRAGRRKQSRVFKMRGLGLGVLMVLMVGLGAGNLARAAEPVPAGQSQAAVQAVRNYVHAVAGRDSARVAQNDFVCLLKMVEAGATGKGQFFA